jgi:hypothetical protein
MQKNQRSQYRWMKPKVWFGAVILQLPKSNPNLDFIDYNFTKEVNRTCKPGCDIISRYFRIQAKLIILYS